MLMSKEWYQDKIQLCEQQLKHAKYPEPIMERLAEYRQLLAQATGQAVLV